MNLPKLLPVLNEAGLENPIVCANVNKIAFRMSGGIEGYREATAQYPARVIAMSVLGVGRHPRRARRSNGSATSLMSNRSCSAPRAARTSRIRWC